MRYAALVFLAACFDPSPPGGSPCGEGDVCPDGLVCTATKVCAISDVDAGILDPNADTDGDGERDGDDNCPTVANADQADEDADGHGDVCDPCPPFEGDSDPDGDGVAGVCDPHPTTPGDRIVRFEGFVTPLDMDVWRTSGSLVLTDGSAVATAAADKTVLLTMPSPATMRVEVRTAATVQNVTATGANLGAINLVERAAATGDTSVACQATGLLDRSEEQLRIYDLDAGTIVNTAAHPFGANYSTEMRLRRDGNAYLCRATNPVLELAGSSAYSPASPRIGLRARAVNATFQWLMVVSSP